MNRIITAIDKITEQIKTKNLPQDKLESLNHQLDMDLEEYVSYQNLKSLASMDGSLTTEEACSVYAYLGNTPEQFNNQPLAVKVVLTQIFKELLDRHITANRK